MNSFVETVLRVADARRRDALGAASRREGRAVNCAGRARMRAAAPASRSRRRRAHWLRGSPTRRTASTSSRRCAASSAPFPTSRAWARRMRPVDEPLRFAQEAELDLRARAGRRVRALADGARPPRCVQRVFGLLGPNGPLPIHLTEYARERALHHGDRTLRRFLDMLMHRFAPVLLPRLGAGAAGRRAGPSGRRADRSPHRLAVRPDRPAELRDRDALGDFAKLHFAGRLARSGARRRRPGRLVHGSQFDVPVRDRAVAAATGCRWPRGAHPPRPRDGQRASGRGAVLGEQRLGRAAQVPHRHRAAAPGSATPRFLPGGSALAQLRALVRQWVGLEFAWDLRLVLKRDDVPALAACGRRATARRPPRPHRAGSGSGYRRAARCRRLIIDVESIRLGATQSASAARVTRSWPLNDRIGRNEA